MFIIPVLSAIQVFRKKIDRPTLVTPHLAPSPEDFPPNLFGVKRPLLSNTKNGPITPRF